MVSWVIWGNLSIETNHLTVTSKDLPEAFDNFSIAHISDLHNAEYGKNNEKLIDILKAESPNIIVITGDLIDSNHTNIEVALSFAQQAVKIAPCYFVTGNHEAWVGSQYEELRTSLENAGVTVLQDEAIELNYGDECIQLIGLNDPDFSERDSFLSESILETKLSQVNISNGFTISVSESENTLDSSLKTTDEEKAAIQSECIVISELYREIYQQAPKVPSQYFGAENDITQETIAFMKGTKDLFPLIS